MGTSVIPRAWPVIVPLVGIVAIVAVPFMRHAQKTRAESAAAAFLGRLHAGQRAFRMSHSSLGYAPGFDSLTMPCPGSRAAPLTMNDITSLGTSGYDATLRSAEGASTGALDCHGRPLVSDYYAAVAPRSVDARGRQAFAVTSTGRIFLFFDGIAPLERDMLATGLATPLDTLDTFKIP